MKVFPEFEHSELCRSPWEKWIVWNLQKSSRMPAFWWIAAIVWTVYLISFPEDTEPHWFIIYLGFVAWLQLYRCYEARALKNILSRAQAESPKNSADKQDSPHPDS